MVLDEIVRLNFIQHTHLMGEPESLTILVEVHESVNQAQSIMINLIHQNYNEFEI